MSILLQDLMEMLKGKFEKGNRDDHGSLDETEWQWRISNVGHKFEEFLSGYKESVGELRVKSSYSS